MSMSVFKGPLLILLGAVCFSCSGTLQALAPEGISPLSSVAVRSLFGSVFLFAVSFAKGNLKGLGIRDIPWKCLALCAFCLLFAQLFFFVGNQKIGVSVGTVVDIGSTPLWAAVVSWILFRKKPSAFWYVATALSIGGIVLLNLSAESTDINLLWIAAPLAGGFAYACYLIFNPTIPRNFNPELSMAFVLGMDCLILLPLTYFFPIDWAYSSIRGLSVALGLGVVTAGVAFSCVLAGLRQTSPIVAATLGLAEPLGATCWGIFLLQEPSDIFTLSGLGCITVSILLLMYGQKQESTDNRS